MYNFAMARLGTQEYLHALGVQVWRRRGASSIVVPEATGAIEAEQPPAVAAIEQTPPSLEVQSSPAVRFTIRCFSVHNCFAAIDETCWGGRRFFLDVARAMSGFASAERRDVRFDWPLYDAPGVDQGEEAARRALRAFVGGQLERCDRALVIGARAAELLEVAVGEGPRRVELLGCPAVVVTDVARTAEAKRELWRLIRTTAR